MAEKEINPGLKSALELGPVLIFFAGFMLYKDHEFEVAGRVYSGLIAVTALLIPLLSAATFALWKLTGKLSPIQVFTLVFVIISGALTVWFNDERFIKIKPTITNVILAAILGIGLVQGKSYLEKLMGEFFPFTQEGWMILTKRVTVFYLVFAAANEVVWRNFSTEFWVVFDTFFYPLATAVFFVAQIMLLQAHSLEDDAQE